MILTTCAACAKALDHDAPARCVNCQTRYCSDRCLRYQKRSAKRKRGTASGKSVEGATQKVNGKWTNTYLFPGREFDDLDAYRAAKKQREERRAAFADQAYAWHH